MKYKIEVWFKNGMYWSKIVDSCELLTDLNKIHFNDGNIGGAVFIDEAVAYSISEIKEPMEFNN